MHSQKPVVRIGRFSATDEPCCGLTPWQPAEPTASSQGSHLGKFPEQALPYPGAHILPSCLPDHCFYHPPLSGCSHLHMWGPERPTQLPVLLSASLLPSNTVFQERWAPVHPPLGSSLTSSLEKCPSISMAKGNNLFIVSSSIFLISASTTSDMQMIPL